MTNQLPQASNFILYTAPNGDVQLNVVFQDETVWLTQRGMKALFNVAKSTLSKYWKNIHKSGELIREATVRNFRITESFDEIIRKLNDV